MTTASYTPEPPAAARSLSRGDIHLLQHAKQVCDQTFDHAVAEDFAGFDPYDGLAARLPGAGLLKRTRLGRLALIQAVRRSPLNLRPLLRVPPLVNPKTLGLLMSACCDLYAATKERRYERLYHTMAARARKLVSSGWSGACWGYPFDWQARAFFLPAGTPTAVCTVFVARGFLAGYQTFDDTDALQTAISACDFLRHDLNRWPGPDGFAFSYSPLDHVIVHNAYALASGLLAQVGVLSGRNDFLSLSHSGMRFLIDSQRSDGSWPYGHAPHHQWTDGFHTGYVLESLSAFLRCYSDKALRAAHTSGYDYYRNTLFQDSWWPKERDIGTKTYVETHTIAEAIILLSTNNLSRYNDRQSLIRLLEHILHSAVPTKRLFPDRIATSSFPRGTQMAFLRWTLAWITCALARVIRQSGSQRSPVWR